MAMQSVSKFEPVEVSPETLRAVWTGMDLGRKVRESFVRIKIQPRYLSRPLTQIITVILPNGWIIAVAHRWRTSARETWSLPDPKRMWIDNVALYCH